MATYSKTAMFQFSNTLIFKIGAVMQKNKLYVGNLTYSVGEDQLRDIFGSYGEIDEITVIKDRDTGRSKGFAFITFNTVEDAEKALEQNGQEYEGRSLRVNVAKERTDRNGGGGGRGGSRGGGGGRRGGYGGDSHGGSGGGGGRNNRPRW